MTELKKLKLFNGISITYTCDEEHTKALIQWLPLHFDDEGLLLYSDRNTVKSIMFDNKEIIAKRFKRNGLIKKIIYTFFRRTKARRAYFNGLELLKRGFATPRPIAFIETYSIGLLKDCFYLCEPNYDAPIGDEFEKKDWNRPLAEAFGKYAAQLQQNGILDNDLNMNNVLFHPIEDRMDFEFSLIDINRMKFVSVGAKIPIRERLENITRFTSKYDLFEFVVRAYARACGFDEESIAKAALKQKNIHDRKRVCRKQFTGLFKKLF